MSWSETFLKLLKDNDVRLITYVPDNVLTPLIAGVNADNYFLPVTATREDEAIGTVSGAYVAGLRGAVMMQTSGFALIANALASLVLPYRPTDQGLMTWNERKTLLQAGLVCASPVKVRQAVGNPPMTVQPAALNQSMACCACGGVSERPLNPKPQMATTGLPLWRR